MCINIINNCYTHSVLILLKILVIILHKKLHHDHPYHIKIVSSFGVKYKVFFFKSKQKLFTCEISMHITYIFYDCCNYLNCKKVELRVAVKNIQMCTYVCMHAAHTQTCYQFLFKLKSILFRLV